MPPRRRPRDARHHQADQCRTRSASWKRLYVCCASRVRADGPPALGICLPDETQIEDLLGRVAAPPACGVAFDSVGEARPLPSPPPSGSTLYRIAQESLTNVLRHVYAYVVSR